jgi:hypothetical protein
VNPGTVMFWLVAGAGMALGLCIPGAARAELVVVLAEGTSTSLVGALRPLGTPRPSLVARSPCEAGLKLAKQKCSPKDACFKLSETKL